MPTSIFEHFIVHNPESVADLEVYINTNNDIFICEPNVTGGFFSIITREDWEELKKFIDKQFEENK